MCVIIQRPRNHTLTEREIANCAVTNHHGWGIMWAENGAVQVRRGMTMDEFWDAYDGLEDKDIAIHFRFATHGSKDLENTHPFQVLNMNDHGADLWMMHNGVIAIPRATEERSDTWHYAFFELEPMLAQAPALIRNENFQKMIKERIGGGSKLLFMDGAGAQIVINAAAGVNHAGCWLSNSYSHTDRSWPAFRGNNRGGTHDADDYYTHGGYDNAIGSTSPAVTPSSTPATTAPAVVNGYKPRKATEYGSIEVIHDGPRRTATVIKFDEITKNDAKPPSTKAQGGGTTITVTKPVETKEPEVSTTTTTTTSTTSPEPASNEEKIMASAEAASTQPADKPKAKEEAGFTAGRFRHGPDDDGQGVLVAQNAGRTDAEVEDFRHEAARPRPVQDLTKGEKHSSPAYRPEHMYFDPSVGLTYHDVLNLSETEIYQLCEEHPDAVSDFLWNLAKGTHAA